MLMGCLCPVGWPCCADEEAEGQEHESRRQGSDLRPSGSRDHDLDPRPGVLEHQRVPLVKGQLPPSRKPRFSSGHTAQCCQISRPLQDVPRQPEAWTLWCELTWWLKLAAESRLQHTVRGPAEQVCAQAWGCPLAPLPQQLAGG